MKKIIIILAIILIALSIGYWNYLRQAHSSFENYYAFRGCQTLVNRTPTSGTCTLASGKTITIVEYKGKWYLEGDLPYDCIGNLCFGI